MPTKKAILGIICLSILVPSLAFAQMAARERSEVDDEYKWNLDQLFTTSQRSSA